MIKKENLRQKRFIIVAVILIGLFFGYQIIMKTYYKITEPLFLQHHMYISTQVQEVPLRMYYFSNKNSDVEVVKIKQPHNKVLDIKFYGDSGQGYSRYHDRHRLNLELIGVEPGEIEINQLTFVFSDGSESTVDIGDIVYKFRKPSSFFESVSIAANGSSNTNRDFAQYVAKKPLTLKKIYYQLPQLKEDILKIVGGNGSKLMEKDNSDEENVKNSTSILKSNIENKKNLQNTDLNLKLFPEKTLVLTSYFDFQDKEKYENKIYSFINAELVFIDENNQEIIGDYHAEYVPYLEASDIRALSLE